MRHWRTLLLATIASLSTFAPLKAQQHSVARQWNEALLECIRNDYARPTVHARNLFHTSVVMYDAWAAYDSVATTFFLGDSLGNYYCDYTGHPVVTDIKAAQEEAISYAAYRLLHYRFKNSPGTNYIMGLLDSLFLGMGYDSSYHDITYASGPPAALGNYIASEMIQFGWQDGSNEAGNYGNLHYSPVNDPLIVKFPGNPDIDDPNRWQPLSLDVFIDQSGNPIPVNVPQFLSPEWGQVVPFSLDDSILTMHNRNGYDYWVYHDPGMPPQIDTSNGGVISDQYKWNFTLVAIWSGHLDTIDSVMWDISPGGIGNIAQQTYPTNAADYPNFYDLFNGGDNSPGHTLNPVTGQPYAPQMVRRGDYGRVLAEFWADGPDSETPPGHWFTILNYVNDHPLFEKRWNGKGHVLDPLEWDVKAYFTLAGGMHDVAVSSWGVKGWYDYIRPVSAIRYMASKGQCTDTMASNFHVAGIPLYPGHIEVVDSNDALAGVVYENVGKIKLYAWRGPDYIDSPDTTTAGVGWILAENWWPYQRPTFITPPFAGYVSGHSTYSRAAAEIMTLMTGDAYFPGGMGEFHAGKNEFLVFEDGPSEDLILQWGTYRDASDQCSLSRIWGGIHPPADDMPGRFIGMQIGPEAYEHAKSYMDIVPPTMIDWEANVLPVTDAQVGTATFNLTVYFNEDMDDFYVPDIEFPVEDPLASSFIPNIDSTMWLDARTFRFAFDVMDVDEELADIDFMVSGGRDLYGNPNQGLLFADQLNIDTRNPNCDAVNTNTNLITDSLTGVAGFTMEVIFDEAMQTSKVPSILFPVEDPMAQTLVLNSAQSAWQNDTVYQAKYAVIDANEKLLDIDVTIADAVDLVGNVQTDFVLTDQFSIDMEEKPNGILEVGGAMVMEVYPNPVGTDQALMVAFNTITEDITLQCFNAQGGLLYTKNLVAQSTPRTVLLPSKDWAAGLYLIHVSGKTIEYKVKVMRME